MSSYSELCRDLQKAKQVYKDMQIKHKNLSDLGMSIDALDLLMEMQLRAIQNLSEKLKEIDRATGTWTGGGGNYKGSLR